MAKKGNDGTNPNSLKNLRPAAVGQPTAGSWKDGQSGNPSGKASRMFTLVTMALREKLASMDVEQKKTHASRIADILVDCVYRPDPEVDKTRLMAINEILDRCEGKPKQQIDVNDVTAELRSRTDEELMYHLEHGHWPEDKVSLQ